MSKVRKSTAAGIVCGILLIVACVVIANMGNHGKSANPGPAKYIFLFIGDGMGATHVAAAESYLSYLEGERGLEQVSFTKFPVLGMASTYSADKNITCSSAAGTAISCGEKTNNGMLGITPDGDTLTSIALELKEKGYKIGIMSSVPVNHATPAAFYGHNASRHDYYGITKEIPASGYNFFAGSGFLDYAGKDGDRTGSEELLENEGYTVCFGNEEYEEALRNGAERIVLCQEEYKGSEVPSYVTEKKSETTIGSAEMMKKCLDFLGDEKPFFIMYEQGEIDWCAHDNKTMPMIEAVLKLDDAVETALEFYKKHPDETLILVTADHETGGITLGATGTRAEVNIHWEELDSAWNASGHLNTMKEDENRKLNDSAFIGWTTHGHTGGPVPVYAIGAGAERFSGRFDNTDIKGKILGE